MQPLTLLLLKGLLFFVAGASNAWMDTSADHVGSSILSRWQSQYWAKAVSWTNKYHRPKWIPVALTDAWHLFKSVELWTIFLAAAIPVPFMPWYLDLLFCRFASFGSGFWIFYNKILPLNTAMTKTYWKYLYTDVISISTALLGAGITYSGYWATGQYKEAPIAYVVGILLLICNPVYWWFQTSKSK